MGRAVRPFYWPPTLLFGQASVLALISRSTGWRLSRRWLRDLGKLVRVAAGARRYGCFGYEPHPVYEVTARCNLRCLHCHARGGSPYPGELGTREAKKVIESIATVREFRMLVFTGGEPLMRRDIFELTEHASSLGFSVVYATNATLITREVARRMAGLGVVGAAVSIDSTRPERHDWFRGVPGAWRRALEGVKHMLEEGLYLQVNVTISRMNVDEMEDLLVFADRLGAHVVLLYTLVSFGRGEGLRGLTLTPAEFADVIRRTADVQERLELVVAPVAAPWYYAYLASKSRLPKRILERVVTGCIAARGMFYVKPDGEVWPCPFLPLPAGNAARQRAVEIWEGPLFKSLRDRSSLGEPCRSCEYREVCGGCRARAYIRTGDPLAGDPLCPFAGPRGSGTPLSSCAEPRRTPGS